jgi:hypothetical protein
LAVRFFRTGSQPYRASNLTPVVLPQIQDA